LYHQGEVYVGRRYIPRAYATGNLREIKGGRKVCIEIATGKILTQEDRNRYFEMAKNWKTETRAKEVLQDVILQNINLVAYFVKKIKEKVSPSIDVEDAFSRGISGLLYAVENCELEKSRNGKYDSYLSNCIEGYIRRGSVVGDGTISDNGKIIRQPDHSVFEKSKLNKDIRQLGRTFPDRKVEDVEIAALQGIKNMNYFDTYCRELMTQYEQVDINTLSAKEFKLHDVDMNGNLTFENPHIETDAKIDREKLKEVISNMLATMSPREERVIRLLYGIGTDHTYLNSDENHYMTLEKVGNQFGVTREHIRQVEARALRRLKHPSRLKRLEKFI
jgi:RNA polymerase primary sigma factor